MYCDGQEKDKSRLVETARAGVGGAAPVRDRLVSHSPGLCKVHLEQGQVESMEMRKPECFVRNLGDSVPKLQPLTSGLGTDTARDMVPGSDAARSTSQCGMPGPGIGSLGGLIGEICVAHVS